MFDNMRKAVYDYVISNLDVTNNYKFTIDDVYIVWTCKALQNWKALISTTLPDGMYYECTYNGNTNELYLDSYKRFENKAIKDFNYNYVSPDKNTMEKMAASMNINKVVLDDNKMNCNIYKKKDTIKNNKFVNGEKCSPNCVKKCLNECHKVKEKTNDIKKMQAIVVKDSEFFDTLMNLLNL